MTLKNERHLLERWIKSPTTPQGVVRRCRIVLLALDGFREESIAATVDVSRPTVMLWIARFTSLGANALLHDAPGRGRRASLEWATVREQLKSAGLLDAKGQPVSLRRAAAFLGVSTASLWRALKRVASESADTAPTPRRRPRRS